MEWRLKAWLLRWGFVLKRRRQTLVRKATSGQGLAAEALMEALHGRDVYEDFDYRKYDYDGAGWGGQSPAFAELVGEVQPSLIIEVGSWKGASALSMAEAAAKEGLPTKILCIDTWLGALEFRMDRDDPERFRALECRHGYPQVYYRFLANVCHVGHKERIIPFPMDSASAALWLMSHGVRAGLIYIDASHEEEAVYQDLLDYREVLAPGGKIFGDDWAWASVRAAVSSFAKDHGLAVTLHHDKWVLGDAGR
jgi:hypothetical protein